MTNLGTGRVVGQFASGVTDGPGLGGDPGIISARGTVTITPNISQSATMTTEPNPLILWLKPKELIINSEGYACEPDPQDHTKPGAPGSRLFANDDPSIGVTDWNYTVRVRMTTADGKWLADMEPFQIFVPSGAGIVEGIPPVDLATFAPIPASSGTGSTQVVALVAKAQAAAEESRSLAGEAAELAGAASKMAEDLQKRALAGEFNGRDGKDAVGSGTPGADMLYTPLAYRGAMGLFKASLSLATTAGRPLTIGFAGSSTTAGHNTAKEKRWVSLVSARLTTNPVLTDTEAYAIRGNLPPGINVVNAGLNGTTSATYLTDGRDTRLAGANPRLVVHTIGSNDYGSNINPATYKASILSAISRIDALAAGPVAHLLVHSYERYDVTPRTYPWSQYRDALMAISLERPEKVAFLDLSATFRGLGVPSSDPLGLMQSDKLHMNDYGHALYADLMASALGLPAVPPTIPTVPAAPTTPTSPAAVVSDDFTRADGALGSTPVGAAAWVTTVGDIRITGGLVTASVANSGAMVNTPLTDCVVGVTGALASQGLLFRANADGSGYYFMWSGGGQEYRVGLRSALGAFTALQGTGTTKTFAAGSRYEVELRGSRILCKVGGETVLDVTDGTHAGTRHGIVMASVTGAPLKNFSVSPLS